MTTIKHAVAPQPSSAGPDDEQARISGESGPHASMAEGDQPAEIDPPKAHTSPSTASTTEKPGERERPRRPVPSTWKQCRIVVYHAWMLKIADAKITFMEFLIPVLAVAIALIVAKASPLKLGLHDDSEIKLVKPNYTTIYSFDPVPLSGTTSYLAHGSFVPMSKIFVAPKSATTMEAAKQVFECVLKMAGYSLNSATNTWTSAVPLDASVMDEVWTGQGPIQVPHPLTTTYVLDEKTIAGFASSADAASAITAGALPNDTWINQAPVALVFDDADIRTPSYSLHFRYDGAYGGRSGPGRLPDVAPVMKGCQPPPVGGAPGGLIEEGCFGSYSNCVGLPEKDSCEVSYKQAIFQTPPSSCSSEKYIISGAAALQLCVDMEIIGLHAKNPSSLKISLPFVSIRMMPRQIQKFEPHDGNVDPNAFFIMLGCGGFTTACVVWLVMIEKERKLKQLLHMVGVTPTAYWFGWFLGYVAIWAVIGFILWLMLFLSEYSPYTSTDGWMLLMVIYMAGINAIVMGFLFVSLFNKALTATLCATTYEFGIALLYVVIAAYAGYNGCVANATYWGLSLFGNYAFILALNRMAFVSKLNGQTTWADFTTKPRSGAMSIGEAFMMQVIDTVIYAILAYYFDQVIPNQYSANRHPLFFVKPSFWGVLFTSNDRTQADNSDNQKVIYDVLNELNANPDVESAEVSDQAVDHVGIATQKLCKDFNSGILTNSSSKRLAVDNLSLVVYKNEITAILGHNGAGKTTTIRMLTGQITPTSGTSYVLGHNIHTDKGLRAVQATLGLTAQDNILWPTLTVAQHLSIFGMLKSMTRREVKDNSILLLEQLDLLPKIDARSKTLSGGQKRRLCLALALIGDPQIVFLDEPSCGVDPQSRRKMWDTLISYKASDKCIVLTTHSMYEADVLADRKLMVSKGKLRCGGSSVFLKNRFGVGYNLNIELDPQQTVADRQNSVQSLTQQIGAIVPNATFPEAYGTNFERLEVQLPKNEMDKYTDLFALLESDKVEHMGLTDIGVSMVSLEEVFLRLSKEDDDKSAQKRESISKVDEVEQVSIKYWTKFAALLRIRFILWYRRPIRYFALLILSILLLWVATAFEELLVSIGVDFAKKQLAHAAQLSQVPLDLQRYRTTLFNSQDYPLIIRATSSDDYNTATQALPSLGIQQHKRLPTSNSYNDLVSYGLAQNSLPYYYAGVDIDSWPSANLPLTTQVQYTVWYNGSFTQSLPIALNVVNSMLYKTMVNGQSSGITTKIYQQAKVDTSSIPTTASGVQDSLIVQLAITVFVPLLYTLALSLFTSGLIVDAVYDKQTGAIRLLRLSNACGLLYWLPMFIVHVITYWIPMAVAFIIFCNVWTTNFIVHNSLTVFTFVLHNLMFVFVMTILAYCASLLFMKVSSAMAANEIVSITVGVMMALIAGLFTSNAVDMLGNGSTVDNVTDATFTRTLSVIFPWWGYSGGLAAMVISDSLRKRPSPPMVWNPIVWNDLYVAAFTGLVLWLFLSLLILTVAEMFTSGMAQSIMAKFILKSTTDSRMREQLELDHQSTLFTLVPEGAAAEDDDVRAERYLANKSAAILAEQATFLDEEAAQSSELTPAITALHLQKRYGQRLRELYDSFNSSAGVLAGYYVNTLGCAVQNVSFRVQPNEIFGLLGPNGAGKTTIMAMLVNETRPTAGLIYIDRYNTLIQRRHATKLLGYCPQFDALWDEVTVAEHLQLMAALHGQQANMVPPNGLIIRMAEKLGLREHWNKSSKQLSGGTRRKLSFLISIIDHNMTSLLDEPSSGMDPGSARYLWDIIKHHFKNRPKTDEVSVGGILTTHYMEEAEALCDRIAIMMKGTVRCIGTPTHLRNKFGSGYRLELRLTDAQDTTRALVINNIMAQFSEAILKKNESRLNRLVFSLPQKQALPLSKSFAFLESQRALTENTDLNPAESNDQARKVVEYTITQASIEHVFLRIVGNQEDEEEKETVV